MRIVIMFMLVLLVQVELNKKVILIFSNALFVIIVRGLFADGNVLENVKYKVNAIPRG